MVCIALITSKKTLLKKVRAMVKKRDLPYNFKEFKSFDSFICEENQNVFYDAYIYDERGADSRIEEIIESYDLSPYCPIILLCEEKTYEALHNIIEHITLNGIIFSANNEKKDALNLIHHLDNILPSMKIQNLDDPTSFNRIIEKAPDGICIIKDREIIYANLSLAELLDCTKDELIGTAPRTYIYDGDLPTSIENYQARMSGEYVPSKYQLKLKTKDGSAVRTEINICKLKIKEEIAIVVFIRDITDLFEKEREVQITKSRLKSIFHSLEDMVFILDKQDKFTFYNSPSPKKLYVEPSAFIGKTPFDTMPEYIHTKINDALENVKKGQNASFEYSLTSEDNTIKWYKATLSPILVENVFDGTLAIIRDITSEKEHIKREEVLSSLLMHDMRNKLHIISAYVDLINQNGLDYSTEQFIKKISEAVDEGQDLISQIGQIKKEGQSEIDVNLKQFLTTIVQTRLMLTNMINNINVKMDVEDLTVSVCLLFKQVLINLIDNVIKHANCSTIYVSTKQKEDRIIIKIEDDGVGVRENEYEKIFEKNYKRKNSKGTGLGLYFSKFIVEKYLGKISAERSKFGGLCITIGLDKSLESKD